MQPRIDVTYFCKTSQMWAVHNTIFIIIWQYNSLSILYDRHQQPQILDTFRVL